VALTDSEVQRIRAELGFHVLSVSAEPYISYVSLFDQIIQPFTTSGAATTSTTLVTAATTATPATLSLGSATGFAAGVRVVVDVDDRQEVATAQSLSGSALTLLLTKAHSGTYPVTVEGGETIIREKLTAIRNVKADMLATYGSGALKAVDEIQFYDTGGTTQFGVLGTQLAHWRDELAANLGIVSAWAEKRAGAGRLSVY